jgi:hypothetical protein
MAVPQKVLGSKLSYQEVNEMLTLYPSDTEPAENLYIGQLWLDISASPAVLKRYTGSEDGFVEVGAVTTDNIIDVIKTKDGPASGLDADTVDGIEGASLLRGDVDCTFTGTLTSEGSGVVMKFDSGHTIFTVHDGSGNFNIKSGVDENHNIVDADGATHVQITETGGVKLAVSTQTVGSTFSDDSYAQVVGSGVKLKGDVTILTQLLLPTSQPASPLDGSIWIG